METNKGPQGISIGGDSFNLSQYADDTVVILNNPTTGIPKLIQCLNTYCKATGMLVNPKKTEGIALGADALTKPIPHPKLPIQWVKKGSHIIGIGLPIGEPDNFDELEFCQTKYNKSKTRIGSMRTLFLKNQRDRICIETSFLTSLFWYFAQFISIPPQLLRNK